MQLLAAGRPAEARRLAEACIDDKPRVADGHRILGLSLQQLGDPTAAEAAFRTGLKLDRSDADLAISLADLLDATSRPADAERVLRTTLEANRRHAPLAARLAQTLLAAGKPEEALQLTAKLANAPAPDRAILVAHAAALKAQGKPEKALAIHERAATLFPDNAVAHHNLAASRGDLGQFEAAERSAARALATGGNAPQTWLVYARALQGGQKLDQADRAFREAIARNPAYLEAHRDLAQLIWMRTEDAAAAVALLDAAIRANPQIHALFALRANILHHAGDPKAAYATLLEALQRHPDQAELHIAVAQFAALSGEAPMALAHAERAAALAPGDDTTQSALFAACLATGDAARASTIAAGLVQRRPLDQRALAYQATAWRLLDDPRYQALYDYDTFVRAWRLDVPEGWPDLDSYLAELAKSLRALQAFRTHPLDQSLRHGSQATHLLTSADPAIRAFFQAVDGPIRRHLAALGTGPGPLRARNTGGFTFRGAWSVQLRQGGFHTDHIHPEGWLSSACYIALPPEGPNEAEAREAWIKFGQPGLPTLPPLPPEHFIKPEPGMLVLFPSYLWHGTMPFHTQATRLSIAFDLLPKDQR